MEFVKEHWVLLAIIGVGAVVLVATMRRTGDVNTGWSGEGSARTAT